MRIPYEKRVDRYEVEWREVEPDGDKSMAFKYATITIHELWSIGHLIFPKEPLKIEVYLSDKDDEDQSALIVYDFGMEDRIPTTKATNFLYDYAGGNAEGEAIKTVFSSIKFDLMHAFFHYKGDPNYGHRHWALIGHLDKRATADDTYIDEDIDHEEAQRKLAETDGHIKTIQS